MFNAFGSRLQLVNCLRSGRIKATESSVRCYQPLLIEFCRTFCVAMPKEPLAARALKAQRIAKLADDRYRGLVPGRVTMHVLGNGGAGNPAVLHIATDHSSYIFNCGEATQRLSHEHA